MRVPTRSAGTRSGVNCRRLNEPPSTSATVFTVSVLASPGTPSSSTWPPASSATSTRSSIASWPTITRLISKSADSSASCACRAGLGSCGRSRAWSLRSSGVTWGLLVSADRRVLGTRTERHRQITPVAAAHHGEFGLLAGLVRRHGRRHVVGGLDRPAVDGDDLVTRAEARLGGRAAGHGVADHGARLVVRRAVGHAEEGALDLAAVLDLRHDLLDRHTGTA